MYAELEIKVPEKELFRPDEVAALFDVTPRTVRNLINRGELESVKVGGQYRISRLAIIDYLTYVKVED